MSISSFYNRAPLFSITSFPPVTMLPPPIPALLPPTTIPPISPVINFNMTPSTKHSAAPAGSSSLSVPLHFPGSAGGYYCPGAGDGNDPLTDSRHTAWLSSSPTGLPARRFTHIGSGEFLKRVHTVSDPRWISIRRGPSGVSIGKADRCL